MNFFILIVYLAAMWKKAYLGIAYKSSKCNEILLLIFTSRDS